MYYFYSVLGNINEKSSNYLSNKKDQIITGRITFDTPDIFFKECNVKGYIKGINVEYVFNNMVCCRKRLIMAIFECI